MAKTKTLNLYAVKTNLSKLVEEAAQGHEIIIAKAGKPRARLVALRAQKPRRRLGAAKGRMWISPDFDAPLPDEMIAAFEGRDDD